MFFEGLGVETGWETYRTDGTPEGTVLVKDIKPGPDSSFPNTFTNVNGTVFFLVDLVNDAYVEDVLWKTDGTAAHHAPYQPNPNIDPEAGTLRIHETGVGGGLPGSSALMNGRLFYSARELWKSDGTAEGTLLVEDAVPGPDSLSPAKLRVVGSRLMFEGNAPGHAQEPWTSDGTAAGTHPVAEIAPIGGSRPDDFVLQGASVVFAAQNHAVGRELFAVPTSALADGDQDGLEDAAQVVQGTDPDDADSDDDGLADGAEVLTHGTDPLDADTDGDGYSDGEEIAGGSNPLDPQSVPQAVPLAGPSGLGVLAALLLALGSAAALAPNRRQRIG